MTEKQQTYKEQENEKRLGKKRFLERMVEDAEAQQLIQDFLNKPEQKETFDERDFMRPFT